MNRPAIVATASAAAALMMCGFAYGADLSPAPVHRPAPIMSPVSAYNWTGVYVGLNGGGTWGSKDPYNIITDRFDQLSTRISGGWLFGGTVGAQVQVGYVVVLGLEAERRWMIEDGTGVDGIGFPRLLSVVCDPSSVDERSPDGRGRHCISHQR
jgi:outer membrane immunogenic protein